MSSKILTAAPKRPHLTFVPLFYSLAGWGLVHAWLVLIDVSSRVHIIAAAPALALVGLSALRASADHHSMEQARGASSPASRWAPTQGALLLLFQGAAFGLLVVNGSVFLLAMAALLLTFVPAAWLPFRTRSVGLAVLITCIGFMSVVLPGFRYIDFMIFPLATWVFWICACCSLLLRAEQSWRAERAMKAKVVSVGAEVRAAACDG